MAVAHRTLVVHYVAFDTGKNKADVLMARLKISILMITNVVANVVRSEFLLSCFF